MKKIFTLALLLCAYTSYAQIDFPDAAFETALLNYSPVIDTNGDNEISIEEADAYDGELNIYWAGITDMTGLEYFTNITALRCHNNNLTDLDVSNNPKITVLFCDNNELNSLIVGNKPLA